MVFSVSVNECKKGPQDLSKYVLYNSRFDVEHVMRPSLQTSGCKLRQIRPPGISHWV
jgi:hypothetical protein